MSRQDTRVMVFAKAPVPGLVKTRLGRQLGMRQASAIYRNCLQKLLNNITGSDVCRVELWCYPDTHHPFFRTCSSRYGVILKRQLGMNLGERMAYAFKTGRQYSYLLLMGSDIPAINPAMIASVIRKLKQGADVVILPTMDGGYGLIALKKHCARLFRISTWSTDTVLKQTLSLASRLGLVTELLPAVIDIDVKSDYIACKGMLKE